MSNFFAVRQSYARAHFHRSGTNDFGRKRRSAVKSEIWVQFRSSRTAPKHDCHPERNDVEPSETEWSRGTLRFKTLPTRYLAASSRSGCVNLNCRIVSAGTFTSF